MLGEKRSWEEETMRSGQACEVRHGPRAEDVVCERIRKCEECQAFQAGEVHPCMGHGNDISTQAIGSHLERHKSSGQLR